MNLAYVTTYDPRDVKNWSGLGSFIARSLTGAGASVELLGPLPQPKSVALWARRALHRFILPGDYLWERSPSAARHYARGIRQRLDSIEADVVLSPGTIPVAMLDIDQPFVFWTDATFAAMRGFYPEYSDVAPVSIRDGEAMERAALDRAGAAIYASDWAASSAIEHYGADPAKVRVVPFGANLDRDLEDDEVEQAIAGRPRDRCSLLFVGIDWKRKGGDVAVAVARELNRAGVPTELVIVGSTFPVSEDDLPFVTFVEFVDKSREEDRRLLESLFSRSHFLVHPARADCSPVVLCEANAFGVPCLATNVGGIPTIVRHGINGLLFEPDAEPAEFAQEIRALLREPENYQRLAQTSYAEYRARLNWKISGEKVRSIIEELREEQASSLESARVKA